jgi:hypothetical protein
MKTLNDIKLAVTELKKIKVGTLNFTSFFNNSTKEINYFMSDEYNCDKWAEFTNEKDYLKAVWKRVSYYNKKGLENIITIK